MKFIVVGLNHKTASLTMREQLVFNQNIQQMALSDLIEICSHIEAAMIVSTCNRTEIYAASTGGSRQAQQQVTQWLSAYKHLEQDKVSPYLYYMRQQAAISHLVRVTAGLDSMILGEPQIFGQIKQSVDTARQVAGQHKMLFWLCEQVFFAAKKVRSESQIGGHAVSLGYAVAKLVTEIFDTPSENTLLLVAAGEMNRLVANNVLTLGLKRVMICNRSQHRAQKLADELQAAYPQLSIDIRPLTALNDCLIEADVVSSCSGSLTTLITKTAVKTALKKRRYRPMLLVDLAVPRDIEHDVNDLDEVFAYSIDDLQNVVEGNLNKRKQAAINAELLVSQLVVDIIAQYQVRQASASIRTYRQEAEQISALLNETALQQLQRGEDAEQVLAELTHRLTKALTHAPSKLLQETAKHQSNASLEFVSDVLVKANTRHHKAQQKLKKLIS